MEHTSLMNIGKQPSVTLQRTGLLQFTDNIAEDNPDV
jgi:hypothetical protein